MNLLLDTHAFLWFCERSNALSALAREAFEGSENTKLLSYASCWEIAIKVSLEKLRLSVPFDDFFPATLIQNGFKSIGPDYRHFRELLKLPFHTKDPFDRLLVAQARVEGLIIVTRDQHFRNYDVPTLW